MARKGAAAVKFRWLVLALAAVFAAPVAAAEDMIILYSSPNFKGKELRVTGNVANLSDYRMNDEVSSLRVISGEWGIYEHKDFKGKAVRVPPGDYPNMESVLFENNEMSSVGLLKPTPPPPPPKAKLPDLRRTVDARTGYDATLEGEGEARIATEVRFRGLTAFVTVSNQGEAPAGPSTLTIEPGKALSPYIGYIAEGRHNCPDGQVPWPETAGGQAACIGLKSGDILANKAGDTMVCAIPALAPGDTARCAAVFSVLYNWLVPQFGDWSIVAVVDSSGKIAESNEKNNGAGAEIAVKGDDLPPP